MKLYIWNNNKFFIIIKFRQLINNQYLLIIDCNCNVIESDNIRNIVWLQCLVFSRLGRKIYATRIRISCAPFVTRIDYNVFFSLLDLYLYMDDKTINKSTRRWSTQNYYNKKYLTLFDSTFIYTKYTRSE